MPLLSGVVGRAHTVCNATVIASARCLACSQRAMERGCAVTKEQRDRRAEFMAGGTLYEAIGKDRSGKLGWYNRCLPRCLSVRSWQ